MNIAIPETPQAGLIPLGNGLIDIRKDEREKTIKEVLEYLGSIENSGSDYWAQFLQKAKMHFLPSPEDELAEKIRGIMAMVGGGRVQPASIEIAKHILDNYELKKEPVDVV